MILSVSRRIDIPNYYSDWFYKRIQEGFLYVRNPFNAHQASKIILQPDIVDCIVFWSKNPENMFGILKELKDYKYYFQFTLTGYGKDAEPGIPDKRKYMIGVFQELSSRIGQEKVVWRYDPILLNERYTSDYHIKAFKEIAESLNGYTNRVVISFVDFYGKTKRNAAALKIEEPEEKELRKLALQMAEIAKENQMVTESCAEKMDLQNEGITHGSCINKSLIEKIIGCRLEGNKDKNQREECGCFESIDIGAYDTCPSGCKYCYANFNEERVLKNIKLYDVNSPLLCGTIGPDDRIIEPKGSERKVKSLKAGQINLFD